MNDFSLSVPAGMLDALRDQWLAVGTILPEHFRNFGDGLAEAATMAARNYADYLLGHPIPGHGALKRPAVLQGGIICRSMNLMAWTIGHEDDKARLIEIGQPEHDMKQDLPTARKARRSKAGALYLIIPFRHGSNGDGKGTRGLNAMPKEIYTLAARMAFSRVTSMGARKSATGHIVPQARYRWGDRLPSGLAPIMKPHHKGDIYAGMVRFRDAATTGQSRAASYITFRTMSQRSDPRSWIRPAQPGLFPLETAMQEAWNGNKEGLESALWADIQVLLDGAGG